MKHRVQHLALAVGLAAVAASSQASPADLVGTYATQDNKGIHEVMKIDRDGDAFVLFDKLPNGTWRKSKEVLVPVTKEEFARMAKMPPVNVPAFEGLHNKGMAVFKVPRGWTQGKFKSGTGYFIFTALGPIELEKR